MVNTLKHISVKKTLITMLIFSLFLSTAGYGTFVFAEDVKAPTGDSAESVSVTLEKSDGGLITFENTPSDSPLEANAVKENKVLEKDGYIVVSRKLTDSEKEKAEKDRTFNKGNELNTMVEFPKGEDILIKLSGEDSHELRKIKIKGEDSKETVLVIKDSKKSDDEEYFLKLKGKENIKISAEFSKVEKVEKEDVKDREDKDSVVIEEGVEKQEEGGEISFEDKLALELSKPYDFKRLLSGNGSGSITSARQLFLGGGSVTWSFTVDDGQGNMNGACVDPTNFLIPLRGQGVNLEKLDKSSHLCKLAYLAKDEFTTDVQQYAVGRAGARILGYVSYNRYNYHNEVNSLYERAKQVTVPEGFEAYIARSTNGGQMILTWRNSPGGYLGIQKTSALPNITDGNSCYSLKGAEYGVYKSRSLSGDSRVDTLVTDSNGRAISKRLPFGTYYVTEIKASKGYEIDSTVYPITIDSSRTAASSANVAGVKEVPGIDPSIVEITKLWSGDETPTIPSLEGTQFTIKYYDGFYTENNLPAKATRTWVIEAKRVGNKYIAMLTDKYLVDNLSDSLYKADGKRNVIPYGTVSIQETKPAFGYTLEGTLRDNHGTRISTTKPYVTQIRKKGDLVALQGGNQYSGNNVPVFGSIKINKVNDDGKSPIPGARFELKNSKGEVVKTAETNSKGEIIFDKLYPDRYTVTELKGKGGYMLLKDPLIIDVPTKLTKAEINSKGYVIGEFKHNERDNMHYKHDISIDVVNNKSFPVPSTGEKPDNYPALFGGLLMAGGLLVSKKVRIKDDGLEKNKLND